MKHNIHPLSTALPISLATLLISACASFRGMPTHGGGKRFDEEQRVVSASIRHAANQMDFSKIKSRRVAIEVTSLETSGTGQAFYPGLGSVNTYYDYYDELQKFDFSHRKMALTPEAGSGFVKDNDSTRDNIRVTPNFEFNPSLRANNNITSQDVDYLSKVLEMRLRHDGFQIVPLPQAEAYIVVLVDALGTNLGRKDFLLAFDDDLKASCEMTYYVINPNDQKVICAARAVSSASEYMERNIRFSPIQYHKRKVETFNDHITPLPTSANSFEGTRAKQTGVYQNPSRTQADQLIQEAEVALDSNDRKNAQKAITALRKLQPDHQNLPDLQRRLREL